MSTDRIALSIRAEDLALALDRHYDFRVQQRLTNMDRRPSGGGHADGMVGLALAMNDLPVGTSYAVWVGIGAVLTVVIAVVRGQEVLTVARALLLAVLIGCVVGLKVVS